MTKPKKKNGFFAVDTRCFAEASTNLNDGVCYLVIAAGTGGDQATTSWSINAVEKRTGISRGRIGEAMERLIRKSLVSRVAGGSHPRYKLATWAQFHKLAPDPTPLSPEQEEVLDSIRRFQALSSKQKTLGNQLLRLNRVRQKRDSCNNTYFEVIAPPEPRLAFIPNTFVSGAVDETPPLERIRRLQDPLLLRLVVDLYRVHLENDGGIAKTVISREYTRALKGEFGSYLIYEFCSGDRLANPGEIIEPHLTTKLDGRKDWGAVWRRFDMLGELGIIEWVPTLFEGPGHDAEPLCPLGYGETDSVEDQLGQAAHGAAVRMLSRRINLGSDAPALRERTAGSQLVPVPRHFAGATMFGIARLRYRPHTARTKLWFSKVQDRGTEFLEKWHEIIETIDLHADGERYFDAA
jgi:hypothetical protein